MMQMEDYKKAKVYYQNAVSMKKDNMDQFNVEDDSNQGQQFVHDLAENNFILATREF